MRKTISYLFIALVFAAVVIGLIHVLYVDPIFKALEKNPDASIWLYVLVLTTLYFALGAVMHVVRLGLKWAIKNINS